MRISPCLIRLCLLTTLVVPLNLGCQASAPRGSNPSSKVTVLPFTIESQVLPGAPADPKETLRVLLVAEASSSAGESLARSGLDGIAGAESITGTVRIPVSLPPDVRGLRAHRQKGHLAAATVRLLRWLKGPPRFRRNRPPEEVLRDAVGEVVERAVERLGKG